MRRQKNKNTQNINNLEKQKVGEFTLPDFNTYYKTIGLTRKFIQICPQYVTEKPEWTFRPTQHMAYWVTLAKGRTHRPTERRGGPATDPCMWSAGVTNWVVSPEKRYVEVPFLGASEYDLIWRMGLCWFNQLKTTSLRWALIHYIRKWRSWHPVPSLHGKYGETVETVRLFLGAPKSLQMVTAAMKLKDAYSLEEKLWPT